jgi:hypothetical protein
MIKLNNAEKKVIEAIKTKNYKLICYKSINKYGLWETTKKCKEAIESLKIKGIIKKCDDCILRLTEKYSEVY